MFEKFETVFDGKEAILVNNLGRYSLADTMECGQCFRYERVPREDGAVEYMTVVKDKLIRVVEVNKGELIFPGMDEVTFRDIAVPYFSLERDLCKVKESVIASTDSEWLISAAEAGEGIAILTQEPWETLMSFIISQNNNIPRIRKIVREISAEYGTNLSVKNDYNSCPLKRIDVKPNDHDCKTCGRCYTFPSAKAVLDNPDGLLPSKPGFRYGYILDAAEKVTSGEVDLDAIREKNSYEYTLEELKKIKGVGDKVASCAALFGFGNLEAFPIDVWMKRAIDTYFDGKLDPNALGPYAGIAQQYIFHYIRNEAKE
ncbi:MAG: DNA-3-methyladenine glycosylase 2 family protein [Clostridia bacterium]|nr:DNA-3-methyladenine glycosylase 2 family protein [Clostridia bacterium]